MLPHSSVTEFRNVLLLYIKQKILSLPEAKKTIAEAEKYLIDETVTDSDLVLDLAIETKISAYDAEYVYLANLHKIPLVKAHRYRCLIFMFRA